MNKVATNESATTFCLALVCMLTLGGEYSTAGEAAKTTIRSMFKCESQGVITYSDVPCSAAADRIDVEPEHIDIGPGQKSEPNKRPAATKHTSSRAARSESIASEQLKAAQRSKQRCERLAERLAAIASTLHRGYSVEQGNRLNEQRRKLEEQRSAEKCR